MFARDPAPGDVRPDPFPHVVMPGLFAPERFTELVAAYPECPPASGPTGHTIHRGDAAFDRVMADSPAWRAFFDYCNSQGFVDQLTALFADEIDRSCTVSRGAFRHVDHIESRADKERGYTAAPAHPPEAVFTRFDFMQGMDSYVRRPHLDHRRRLATLLVYFDTPGPDTFTGGSLILHDATGAPIATIPPAANQGVFFPCSERSWHSVDAVRDCRRPRRFMQVAMSSCHPIWPAARLPDANLFETGKRMLKGLLRATAA